MEKTVALEVGSERRDKARQEPSRFLLRLPTIFQRLIWPGTRLILTFFGHFKVEGIEHLEQLPKGVIFAANHTSEIDAIMIPAALPFTSKHLGMFYTSREQSFYKRSGWRQKIYGGTLFKMWGAYPVKVGVHDYESSLAWHIRLLELGKSICIFPEGRKTDDGKIQEGKGGLVYLSYRTKRPIVPVMIEGAFQIRLQDFLFRKRRLRITFGKPLYIENVLPNGAKLLLDSTHDDCRIGARKVMEEIKLLSHST